MNELSRYFDSEKLMQNSILSFPTMLFSKGQEEMLAHQVCMVFIWKVFKSQNKISIYSPRADFLSTQGDCLERNFLTQKCKLGNI